MTISYYVSLILCIMLPIYDYFYGIVKKYIFIVYMQQKKPPSYHAIKYNKGGFIVNLSGVGYANENSEISNPSMMEGDNMTPLLPLLMLL